MFYSTDRSKAVVPVLSLTLCCFVVYSTRPCVILFSSCVFSPLSIAITSLEREREREREREIERESYSKCFS